MNYIIDIDGTLMDTDIPYEGAVDFFNFLINENVDFLLMTNSIKKVDVQVERLRNAGLYVQKEKILNPIAAINEYISERRIRKARIIGTDDEISQVIAKNENKNNEITILLDFEKGNKGYLDLQTVLEDLEKGIEVITASISAYYYKSGKKTIDTGAFVSLLENVSGKKIVNFGKPSRAYFDIAGRILKSKYSEVYVIGDDWSTDVKGAKGWGAKSILVKTGKYKENDEKKESPFMLINSLSEMKRHHRSIASI